MSPSPVKPYCLRCYAPLGANHGMCAACGYSNPISIRQKYWTREPSLVRLEATLKVSIFVLTLGATIAIGFSGRALGWMAGWNLAVPLFLAFPLWMTVSCFTSHATLFNPMWFWTAVFGLMAFLLSSYDTVLATIPLVLIAAVVGFAGWFRRWKTARITARQSTVEAI